MDRLTQLCDEALKLKNIDDDIHRKRLTDELYEIHAQAEEEYFIGLYDKKVKFAENENNLLVAYLLDLVPSVDMQVSWAFVQGEFPDIDTDYHPDVRDYLKNTWAAERFGADNICSISTYGTLGIKSASLDMTKVHNVPKDEIQAITVKMQDKDNEGKPMEWDKALEMYPDFRAYCEANKDIAEAAKMLVDRNKSHGVHAGGLIISNQRISDFVPLEVRSTSKEDPKGIIVSAWTEGQATQDLQPVGLIKFDMLVVNGLNQYSLGAKLVKERYNLPSICALPGGKDWSDISYLNDPASIALADKADLIGIFQFDSEGMRKVVKNGGATCFDDLAAYSALYRPGPLNEKMDKTFCDRKRGTEKYTIHPLLRPILGPTYGVMIFQEQVMQILNVVGGIPLIHCEKIRKAISKKKEKDVAKYKEQFIVEGQIRLNVSEQFVVDLYNQVLAFAAYGFNASHSYAYAYISARQLFLKAHYPLEFFCAVLMCEKDETQVKEYKKDAVSHNVPVVGVHINKSKVNFSIGPDDKIYFGFSNIKGIGSDIAQRIVDGQPYASFADFLQRFGTDMKVLKPLISLGVFEEEYDRITLYKFYEFFKNTSKRRRESEGRFTASLEKYQQQLDELLMKHTHDPNDVPTMNRFEEDCYKLWKTRFGEMEINEPYKYKGESRIRKVTVLNHLEKIVHKKDKSIRMQAEKQQDALDKPLDIHNFNPSFVKLEKEIEDLLKNTKSALRKAESDYYGFQWVHELEESPVYAGYTIEKFDQSGQPVGTIEVKINKKENKTAKNGNQYWSLKVEDANGRNAVITVWSEDYERFAEEFCMGNLIRIQVKAPSNGFPSYTMHGPKKHERARLLPRNKEDDMRVYVLPQGHEKIEMDKKHIEDFKPVDSTNFDILVI